MYDFLLALLIIHLYLDLSLDEMRSIRVRDPEITFQDHSKANLITHFVQRLRRHGRRTNFDFMSSAEIVKQGSKDFNYC